MLNPSAIKAGGRYAFLYPSEFVTLPEYSAARGKPVTVVREATASEVDAEDGDAMFVCVDDAGTELWAWASELGAL